MHCLRCSSRYDVATACGTVFSDGSIGWVGSPAAKITGATAHSHGPLYVRVDYIDLSVCLIDATDIQQVALIHVATDMMI